MAYGDYPLGARQRSGKMKRVRLWFRGWWYVAYAVKKTVMKKHGMGGGMQRVRFGFHAGLCGRYIIYGQHYRK